jgi:hypothetical protein
MGLVMVKSVKHVPRPRGGFLGRGALSRVAVLTVLQIAMLWLAGCAARPRMLPTEQQIPIDRSLMISPPGYAVRPFVRGLSAPVAMAWDEDGSLIVAEGGNYDDEPRIIGFKKDGSFFQIYPYGRRLFVDIGKPRFSLYGPIGGMKVYKGRVYVSHRDTDGYGMITALDYGGGHTTIVAHLPASGDYGMTDMAINPTVSPPRLYFGVGAATNSGVVGIDNWDWVRGRPDVHDIPAVKLRLMGFRFDSPNPFSGLFGPADIAVTAPFQPFNVSNQTEVNAGKFAGAAIYSCVINGGDVRLEGHGIRYPRGLGFNGYFCFFTNQGMELRGTRPIKDDPDSLLRLNAGGGEWFGWPDYTTDLQSIELERYQPPLDMIARTGYPFHVLSVINKEASDLAKPDSHRETSLFGVFSPLSGASKFDFVPNRSPLNRLPTRQALIALAGDCAPYSTSGRTIKGPLGYKIVAVDIDRLDRSDPGKGTKNVADFVANTAGGPGSRIDSGNPNLLERPVDVKFGPDGFVYILDAGRMHMRDGRQEFEDGTGRIFILMPQAAPMMYHGK